MPGGVRIVIVGGPRTGKTTLSVDLDKRIQVDRVRATDDLIGSMGWSEVSATVSTWFDEPGSWVIEGVATARALRKWLASHPEGKPCDVVVLCVRPLLELREGQERMAKGVWTVWSEIYQEIQDRGCRLVETKLAAILEEDPSTW